jgi:hypothetical protein
MDKTKTPFNRHRRAELTFEEKMIHELKDLLIQAATSREMKFLLIRLGALLVLTPFGGFGILRYYECVAKFWKTSSRARKWRVFCFCFFLLNVIGGFLQ